MLKGKGGQPFYKDFWFWVKVLIFAVFLVFLVYPFSTLVINSFFSSKAEGVTLYNFERFFTKKYYNQALGNSLMVSLIPTITSILIGVPMAYLMTRFNIAGKTFWHVLIILSLMCPPFLGAYSWIILFGNAGVVTKWLTDLLGFQMPSIYGLGGICAVFTLKLFPYVYLYVSGAMGSIDRSVEECAENLGSGKLRRLLTVTIPVVTPSIAAGALMVFMTALADFGTPGILAGGDFRTLPVLIFNEYLSETGGNANLASAISMIIVVISLLILFLQKWWVARKNYTMSALRPPEIAQYHGWKRFLVTLPVAVVSLVSFLPQVIVIFCSFVKTNYSNFVFSEGFTLSGAGQEPEHQHPQLLRVLHRGYPLYPGAGHTHVLCHRPPPGQDRRRPGHADDGPLRHPRLGAGPVLHRGLQQPGQDRRRHRHQAHRHRLHHYRHDYP